MRGALKALDDELHKREGKGTAISLHLRHKKKRVNCRQTVIVSSKTEELNKNLGVPVLENKL
jgi:hypothetical protein